MVADRVSPSKCSYCGSPLAGELAPHLCQKCGKPQPLKPGEDYFEAFGVKRGFRQDRSSLEKRFYFISRALHPDRFSALGGEAKQVSLERMSFVNEAYSTLKDPVTLRNYLLAQERIELPKDPSKQIPAELAEQWFELQDLAVESDDSPAIGRALAEFGTELSRLITGSDEEIRQLEGRYDETQARENLIELASKIQRLAYYRSLERQLERLKAL